MVIYQIKSFVQFNVTDNFAWNINQFVNST